MRLNVIAMLMIIYSMIGIMCFSGDYPSKGMLLDSAVWQFRWIALVFALLSLLLMLTKKQRLFAISNNITCVFVVALLFIETLSSIPVAGKNIELALTIAAATPVLFLLLRKLSNIGSKI